MAEIFLIALGPKREPDRKELAVSNGAPAMAKSSPSAESTFCILMNVPILQNLGEDKALAGCLMSLFYCFDTVSDTYYALAKKHNLKLIPIARNRPLILLASKKNPLSRKKEIPFDSITDYKFIMYENFKFDEWLKILNFKNDNNILYVFDRGGLIDAIRQSRYVTVMMKRFTDTYSEDCVEISIVDSPFGMDAYCLHHASYTMNSREK